MDCKPENSDTKLVTVKPDQIELKLFKNSPKCEEIDIDRERLLKLKNLTLCSDLDLLAHITQNLQFSTLNMMCDTVLNLEKDA